eukprot:2496637-Alexandrium_andersonii.AAC.1
MQTEPGKHDPRFLRGLWLGKSERGDERTIATSAGAVLSRSVKRLHEGENYDSLFLQECRGL